MPQLAAGTGIALTKDSNQNLVRVGVDNMEALAAAGRLYESTADGIADTVDGDFFFVFTVGGTELTLYKNVSEVATAQDLALLTAEGAQATVDATMSALSDAGQYNPLHAFRSPATAGFWWDFSDLRNLFTDTARTTALLNVGNTIKGGADKSPFANHVSQSTTGFAPLFARTPQGLLGAYFDGVDDYLESADGPVYSHAGSGEITVVAAVQCDPQTSRHIYAEVSNSDNDPRVGLSTGGASATGFGGDNGAELNASAIGDGGTELLASSTAREVFADSQNRIVTLRVTNTGTNLRQVDAWIDDRHMATTAGALNNSTNNKAGVGAAIRAAVAGFFRGYIFEMVGVNDALAASEILALQTYLARKHFTPKRSASNVASVLVYPTMASLNGRPLLATTTRQGTLRLTDLSISRDGFRGPAFSGRRFGTMDSHMTPAVRVMSDGKVVLIGAPHAGAGLPFATSVSNAGDISTAWPTNRDEDPAGMDHYTYTRYFEYSGTHYVMLRARTDAETDTQYGLWLLTTTNIVTTAFGGATKLIAGDRPYAVPSPPTGERVDLLISTGNPVDASTTNDDIFHGYYLLAAGTLHKTDGTAIALPAAVTDFTSLHSEVSTGLEAWTAGPPWLGADGHPRAVYIRYNADGSQSFMFRRWTGSVWTAAIELARSAGSPLSTVHDAANYIAPGNFYPDPLDPNVVFLSRNIAATPGTDGMTLPHQIWRYVTEDNGVTWNGTQLTFEQYAAVNPVCGDWVTEPRLAYQTGVFRVYNDFDDVRRKLVHSGNGRDDVL